MTERERKQIRTAFRNAVNMGTKELERWLATDESQSVGWTREGDEEAVGHKSGRRIVQLKRKEVSELSADDYAHMKRVIGYVHRHSAQRRKGDVT
jgi:hypothetical protein